MSNQYLNQESKLKHIEETQCSWKSSLRGDLCWLPSSLKFLNVSSNTFAGAIPNGLANLTQLHLLKSLVQSINGRDSYTVSFSLVCNTLLTIVQLGFNAFSDVVRPKTTNCDTDLQVLDLRENRISGRFPMWLTYILPLTNLDVSANFFSGEIPPDIDNLKKLEELKLVNNSRDIPVDISQCSSLSVLDFEGNRLTAYMKALKVLSLGKKSFSGYVPSSLVNPQQLDGLNLGQNKLNGSFPVELMALTNLSDSHDFRELGILDHLHSSPIY